MTPKTILDNMEELAKKFIKTQRVKGELCQILKFTIIFQ